MKRLLTLLFTLAVAFSLAMPVFAQETTGQETAPKAEKKEKQKVKKEKEKVKKEKVKKEKKEAKEKKKEGETGPQ